MTITFSSTKTPFNSNSRVMIEVSPAGAILDCNGSFERLCGHPQTGIQGKMVWSLFDCEDDRRRLREKWGELASGACESAFFEGAISCNGGEPQRVFWVFDAFMRPDGTANRILGVGTTTSKDVTIESHGGIDTTLCQGLIENAPDMVGVFTEDLICRYVSPAVERVTGYGPADLTGLTALEFVHTDDLPKVKVALLKATQTPGSPTSTEARFRYKDGSWHPVEVIVTDLRADPSVAGIVVNGRDVTERRRIEQEVRERDTRYRDLFQQSRDAVYVLNREGQAVDFNQAALELFGATAEQAHRMRMTDVYVNPADERVFRNEIEARGFIKDREVRLRRLNGDEIVCLSTAVVWRDDAGRILGYQGVVRDITRQKELEGSLEEEVRKRTADLAATTERLRAEVEQRWRAESMYRGLLQATKASVVRVNQAMKRTFISEQTASFAGKTEDEILRGTFADSVVPDEREGVRALLRETFRTGHSVYGLVTKQLVRGDHRYVLSNWEPIRGSAGEVAEVQVTSVDITELILKEKELSRRLEAERLIADISGRLVNSTDEDLDAQIDTALEGVGRFASADRGYVFLVSADGTQVSNTHEWCAEGVRSEMQNLQNLPVETVSWWMRKIYRFEEINVPRVAELPEEADAERQILQAQDIKSVFVIPMFVKGQAIGFIGFDSVREEREWPEEDLRPLKVAAEILARAMERRKASEALHRSEELYRSLVEATGGGVERIGRNYRRLYASENTPRVVGRDMDAFMEGRLGDGLVPGDREKVSHAVDTVFQTGKAVLGIVTRTVAGLHILANLSPIKDAHGRVKEVQITSFDITELRHAQEEARETGLLRSLSRRLVQVQESEREAIARELHDEIGQGLTALRLMLDGAERSSHELDATGHRRARELVQQIIGQVRDVSANLRPPMLDDLGLASALGWHLARFSERTGLKVNTDGLHVEDRLDPEIELAAYRIVQESLTNVAKHARVSEAVVSVSLKDGALCVQIEDKGVGFRPELRQVGVHHGGLIGMRERANAVGGTLEIVSEPGRGTRVIAQIPIRDGGLGGS